MSQELTRMEGLIPTIDERREKEAADRRRSKERASRLQVLFNIILAIATVVNAAVAGYQGVILARSLSATQIQAKASVDAVAIAREGVDQAGRIAKQTLAESRRATDGSLEESHQSRRISLDALRTAQEANRSNRDAFRFDQRPWL